jgi:hypothetical protein
MPTAAPIDDYRKAAKEKFAYVKGHMGDFAAWKLSWKLGNSLDTLIDCLVHVDSSGAEKFGQDASALCMDFLNGRDPDWVWFDDYGWFVISADRASLFFSGKVRKEFEGIRDACWERFKNAAHTWCWRRPGTFSEYGPVVVLGGVWNTLWKGTSNDHLGDKEDGDPSWKAIGGKQNTVTNALYLICAQRRGDDGVAADQYGFLEAWLSSQQRPNLWWPQNNGGALVRERVSRVGNGKPAPGFQKDWAWTGDQGLILGGLIDRIAKGQNAAKALTYAEALLTGVRLSLVETNGLLLPCTITGTPPHLHGKPPDRADYATGTGVFWRYLLQAWNLNNPDLRRVLGSEEYKKFVQTNADAALAPDKAALAPDKDGLAHIHKGDMLINQLAVLVAAIVMLSPPN